MQLWTLSYLLPLLVLAPAMQFEYALERINHKFAGRRLDLFGRIDVVTKEVVWEVKCVSALRAEHTLQLACYAWYKLHAKKARLPNAASYPNQKGSIPAVPLSQCMVPYPYSFLIHILYLQRPW